MLHQIQKRLYSQTRKSTQLRHLLTNGETNFLMEAHNGLSAKIVDETGF